MTFFAADADIGLGWVLAVFWVLVLKWGWLVGLGLMVPVFYLRRLQNPRVAVVLVGLILTGMLLLASSVGLQLGVWLLKRDRMAPPVSERRASS
jgi:hypothetical protein